MADDREVLRGAIAEADRAFLQALEKRGKALIQLAALGPEEGSLPSARGSVFEDLTSVRSIPQEHVANIVREVVSASQVLASPKNIAHSGHSTGFSEIAVRAHFGHAVSCESNDSITKVIESVVKGRASHGVVPLETSTDGAVTETLHGLVQAEGVKICAEVLVPLHYHLFSASGNLGNIEKVYGAAPSLAACSRFLREQLPQAVILDVPHAELAPEFADADAGAAVVGTEMVGRLFPSLKIAVERVEDHDGETRFAIIGSDLPARTGHDRTVLSVAASDSPGSLYASLKPFADREINLTRIESRPTSQSAFRYLFFIELDGHITDRSVLAAVSELRAVARFTKILGSYPVGGSRK